MIKQARHIIHGSRLIYIYLITILVSGGIMVYLSLNSISNFRELTEKRILEEEKAIHEDYSNVFQTKLEELAADLDVFISQDSSFKELPQKAFENKLVSNYLVMLENGALIRPLFAEPHFSPSLKNNPKAYWDAYVEAVEIEFKGNDLKSSEGIYAKALKYASTPLDSTRVYNALSRLQIKMNQPERALDYYRIVVEEFGNIENNFGIPYAYFSIDQALKLGGNKFRSQQISLFNIFITKLNKGIIPFTLQTGSLLDSYEREVLKLDAPNYNSISNELRTARASIFQIINYRSLLLATRVDSSFRSFPDLNGFRAVKPEHQQDTILLAKFSENKLYGFPASLASLHYKIKDSIFNKSYRFEYQIETKKRISGENNLKPNSFQAGFSTYFPGYNLKVSLKNESVVDEFVFQRALITLIGLFLLLVAMIIGLIMLVRDVSQKRRMEKLRSDFIANVTHELKTPLTSITMFADSILMDRYKSEEGLKKYTKVILKESEKLKRMINNILEFSRQETNGLKYTLKEENIIEIIHQIMDEMNYWLEINNFKVTLELEEAIYCNVDDEGLKQVLSNLITNAIKYSTLNKHIIIRAYNNSSKAYIEVTDHGIGIQKDKQESIFKKFYRIQEQGQHKAGGTGLGLTVSKDIVEAMGGTLTVESELNQGSTFRITLNISVEK